MFIDRNSITVDGVSMGQYITEAKYGFNKLWSSDTGRTLSGNYSGTLIGIFPKIILQFRRLTKAELEIIAPILDKPKQSVRYYDPKKKTYVTMQTYTGDYEVTNKNIINATQKNEGFSCSFISIKKRS